MDLDLGVTLKDIEVKYSVLYFIDFYPTTAQELKLVFRIKSYSNLI